MKAIVICLFLTAILLQARGQSISFKETIYKVGKSPEQSKVTDLNNDGLLDVVVLTERKDTGYVKILYQDAFGILQLSPTEYCTENGAERRPDQFCTDACHQRQCIRTDWLGDCGRCAYFHADGQMKEELVC